MSNRANGDVELVASIISQERLTNYRIAAGGDEEFALALYGWNIQISEAFFPVLSAAEVCLRNTVSSRLIQAYNHQWWNNEQFHLQIGNAGKGIVLRARRKLTRSGPVTSGRMIAELTFGFWVTMLKELHRPVLWENLHISFADLPESVTYDQFYYRCNEVREFRNRVFHHEPIINCDILLEYSKTLELIAWISSEKGDWIKNYSRVPVVARTKPRRQVKQNQKV